MPDSPSQTGPGPVVSLLGGRGMLGSDLAVLLRQNGCQVRVFDLPEWDITRPDHCEQALAGSDILVNCAAYTNVDGAEQHADLARRVNAEAPGRLGQLAAAAGVYAVHISTDFVFDGTLDRPYREDDIPKPISVYGATKLAGEEQFLDSGCRGLVLRVQWTYGAHGTHFVSKFLSRARSSDALMMVEDQVGSPTWTRDVSRLLLALLERRPTGILHCAARGYATRFEVAREILATCGLSGKSLRPCRTADFPAAAARPLNSRFDCARLDSLLGLPRPHWQASLRAFLASSGASV